jgi:hypothetical protein
VVNEEDITEDQGFEMRSIEEAKTEAAVYLFEAAKSHFAPVQDHQEIVCTVKDVNKHALLRLRLILEISGAR